MRTTQTTSERLRALLKPGRPQPRPQRRKVLDDALLGSSWHWDADDARRDSVS